MDHRKDEAEPFLRTNEEEREVGTKAISSHSTPRNHIFTTRNFLIHLLISSSYIVAISLLVFSRTSLRCVNKELEPELYSPAQEAIHHHLSIIDLDAGHFEFRFTHNPFVGDPRPELDHAWDDLLRNIHIHVTPTEFEKLQPQLNRSSLRLPNGDPIIRLGVYHELHCLKWIRKWMHREHYWPELEGEALDERKWHIEHCLEHFRLQTMATASLSPATLHFSSRNNTQTIEVNGRHVVKVADWDALQTWTEERRVDLTTVDWSTLLPE